MYAAFAKSVSSKPEANANVQSLSKCYNELAEKEGSTNDAKSTKSPEPKTKPKTNRCGRKMDKELTPFELFTKTVAIAGLDEAFHNKFKPDRLMFRLALIFALGASFYLSYAIYFQFRNREAVFNILPLKDTRAPFPNVSFCIPFSLNRTAFQQIVVPEKIAILMQKHSITLSDTIDYMSDIIVMRPEQLDFASPLHVVSKKLYRLYTQPYFEKPDTMFQHDAPPCDQTLSNCAFDGDPVDCCNATWFNLAISEWCYHLDLNLIEAKSNQHQTGTGSKRGDETMRLEKSGFSVDVSIDWTNGCFMDGTSSDGFHVFIDSLFTLLGNPISIPSGADALITLAEAQKVNEITDCYSKETAVKLKYFDYYDPYGITCMCDWLQQLMVKNIGGTMPILSDLIPVSFDHLSVLSLSISDTGNLTKDAGNNFFESMVAQRKVCLQLCSRWTYRVMSAGYGYVRYRDEETKNLQASTNRTWSRIRVIMPEASWRKKEEARAASYLIMCEIGGMISVYIGFSMITFAEVFAHGVYIFWYKWRRRRVWPA